MGNRPTDARRRGATLALSMALLLGPLAPLREAATQESAPRPPASGSRGTIVVESATVFPEHEIEVPAPVTGRISSLPVFENQMVDQGTEIARIDDGRAVSRQKIAAASLAAAELEANDETAILEAEATLALAKVEHGRNLELAKTNSISTAEVDRTELAVKQAELKLANRRKQLELAVRKLDIARLELAEAEAEVERYKVTSPAPGNIYSMYLDEGEWVTEGEPLVKIVRMEWLRVEGTIDKSLYNREDVHGRRVTIEIDRARGETVRFEGQVTWTGLREVSGRNIQVRATVRNQIVADHWVLHPGAHVRMTIHDEPGSLAELPDDLRR